MMTKRQIGLGFVGMLIMLLLLTTSYAMVNTSTIVDLMRKDQQSGIERSKQTKANTEQIEALAEQIRSCTSPDGKCFKQGQARTGKAVASINDVILATAACDQGSTPLLEIRACVAELLKTGGRQ